nr:hypothetical protein [Pandoravirus massiliensis]
MPLTVYSTSWLGEGDEYWPKNRPRVPVPASARVPETIAGLPDGSDPAALVLFERLAESRHHGLKAAFKAGVAPYSRIGLTLLSRAMRRNEDRYKECAGTLSALRAMRRQLFADRP